MGFFLFFVSHDLLLLFHLNKTGLTDEDHDDDQEVDEEEDEEEEEDGDGDGDGKGRRCPSSKERGFFVLSV